jgi:hypothetical protein
MRQDQVIQAFVDMQPVCVDRESASDQYNKPVERCACRSCSLISLSSYTLFPLADGLPCCGFAVACLQRYGPPPSYPNLKVPGLNAPIPPGAQFGYQVRGGARGLWHSPVLN